MLNRPSGEGRKVTFDTENRGFVPQLKDKSYLHIIHCMDMETKEHFRFFDDYQDRIDAVHLGEWETLKDGTYEDGIKFLKEAYCVIIQNGSGYDWHVFEKHYPELMKGFNYFEKRSDPYYPFRVMDTYTMSCTLNPERRAPYEAILMNRGNVGAHSIEAHGIRMGRHKPEHEDWSHLSPEMLHRCEEDVEIGADFYHYLMKEWMEQRATKNKVTGMDIGNAYYCEHRTAFTMARQALRGFAFDVGYASELLAEMDKELEATERMFRPQMPKKLMKKKLAYSAKQLNAMEAFLTEAQRKSLMKETHGSASATIWSITNKPTKRGSKINNGVTKVFPEMVGYLEDHKNPIVAGAFTPISYEDYSLGNRDVVKQVLYPYGWRGVNLNDTELEHNDEYHKLLSKGRLKAAKEHGELPYLWSGKIDEDSIDRWKYNAAVAHGWNPDDECAGELDLYVETHKVIPDWALGIARWYIISSRRTQILNKKDVIDYKNKKRWTKHNGKAECRGLLAKAVCQDTGMTAQEYFEKHGMFPDEGHWRIPAIAFHAATNTFRMRHRNVVNIPSRGLYGKDMRALFIARDGYQIVGCDGAGLELRMLAHFMNDPEYMDVILNGDIHTYNQNKAGLPIRDMAKTFIYAFLYGSGIPNLARVCGISEEQMSQRVQEFKDSLPALTRLLDGVQGAAEAREFLVSIDGRRGRIRKRGKDLAVHTALNVLLQMTGSIIMKWGHIIAEDLAVERGLIEDIKDFPIVAHVHDEAQMEVPENTLTYMEYNIPKEDWKAEEKLELRNETGMWSAANIDYEEDGQLMLYRVHSGFGECYAEGIKRAGEMFNMRCPTAGEYKVGDNWWDTH